MKLSQTIRLALGTVALLLFALWVWQAGKTTHGTWQQYQTAEQKLSDIRNAPQVLARQKARLATLSKQASSLQSQSLVLKDPVDLASYLDGLCKTHSLRLVSLPRETLDNQNGYAMATTAFSLKGGLEAILKAVYQIEQTDRAGMVSRLVLETRSYFERGKENHELVADIQLKRLIRP